MTDAADGPGVGVEEQLARVAAQAVPRVQRSLHPVAVGLSGPDAGDDAVPDPRVVVVQLDLGLVALVVEEAHGDPFGDGRGDREVNPAVHHGRAEVGAVARPGLA